MATKRILSFVMAGHSRLKDGVASRAYVPAIHVFLAVEAKAWTPGTSPGLTENGEV